MPPGTLLRPLGDHRRALQRQAHDLGRIDDSGLHHIDIITGLRVEAITGISFVQAMWLATAPSQAATLTVTVLGLRSNAGELLIGVYESADGFRSALADSATKSALLPEKWRVVGASLRAKVGSQSIAFKELPPGRYAIIVFHDENDNGLLDENAMGVPVEGYGFSNDAQGFLSAPSFNAAAITLPPSDEIIDASISLIYPRAPSSADKEDFDQFMGSSEAPNYQR